MAREINYNKIDWENVDPAEVLIKSVQKSKPNKLQQLKIFDDGTKQKPGSKKKSKYNKQRKEDTI